MSEYVRSGRGRKPGLLRRIDESAPEVWPLRNPETGLENQVHLVLPSDCDFKSWFWAPTSCNCFRRDALQLFLENDRLGELRSCTDAYLIRGIAVLMGSVVIDRALAIYRLHRKLVIDHLFASAELFLHKLESPHQFIKAVQALDAAWPRIPSTVRGCRSYAAGKAVTQSGLLARELGLYNFVLLLRRLKLAPHVIGLACLRRNNKAEA
jgi:hypothetical protein